MLKYEDQVASIRLAQGIGERPYRSHFSHDAHLAEGPLPQAVNRTPEADPDFPYSEDSTFEIFADATTGNFSYASCKPKT